MNNYKRITGHVYSIKNQNGFNNALYDYFGIGIDSTYSKGEVRKMVQNFPTKYPTNIVIIDQSFECRRVYIECFDLNDFNTNN